MFLFDSKHSTDYLIHTCIPLVSYDPFSRGMPEPLKILIQMSKNVLEISLYLLSSEDFRLMESSVFPANNVIKRFSVIWLSTQPAALVLLRTGVSASGFKWLY